MRQFTSALAYAQVDLPQGQERVLRLIAAYPGKTDRELAQIAGEADPNRIRPRRAELADRGLIKEAGHRRCSVTGKTAIVWRVNDDDPQMELGL